MSINSVNSSEAVRPSISAGENRGSGAYANFVFSMNGFFNATSGTIGAFTGQLNEMYQAGQGLNGELQKATDAAQSAGENASDPQVAMAEIAIAQTNVMQVNNKHSRLANKEQMLMSFVKSMVETEVSGKNVAQSLINVMASPALVRNPLNG